MSPLRFFVALFLITLAVMAGTNGILENSVDGGPNAASPLVRERRGNGGDEGGKGKWNGGDNGHHGDNGGDEGGKGKWNGDDNGHHGDRVRRGHGHGHGHGGHGGHGHW